MNLAKTSLLSFISTAIKMLSGLVINKLIAVYIGPSGLAVIGQLQNCLQIAMTLGQGALNNGVVKYTAEKRQDRTYIRSLFSTALKFSLACSAIVSVVLYSFSGFWSEYIFKKSDYTFVFKWLSITLVLYVINSLLISILNGLKEIKTYITINIVQSIVSLFFTGFAIYSYGLDGALIALVTNQSFVLIILLWLVRDHSFIQFRMFSAKFNYDVWKQLLGYTLMALVSICLVPVCQILIRDNITVNVSSDAAGYWQAITYISNVYLMIVTTALSVYYLPRLSEIEHPSELRAEILLAYKYILPIVSMCALVIYFFRDLIINILFSSDFINASSLFMFQLIGDVLKIAGWILGMLLSAKAKTLKHIYTQVIFTFTLYYLTIYMVDLHGVEGAVIAHAINYAIFLPYIYFITRELYAQR